MRNLILAAALSVLAAPAFAHDYPTSNTPNNPNNTGGAQSAYDAASDRYADARAYDRDRRVDDRYADGRRESRDFWRDRAVPDQRYRNERDSAERAWDGLPHYY
jgi:hypothetical protein